VILRGGYNRYRFELGDDLSEIVEQDTPPEGTCVRHTADFSVEYTPLALAPGFLELGATRRDEEGCLVVDWILPSGDGEPDTQRMCIPDWAFPFEQGESLSVAETLLPTGERRLRITRYVETRIDQQLSIWNHAAVLEDSQVVEVVGADCVGELSECGAYVRTVEVELPDDEGVVVEGDEADLKDGSDEIRALVGAGRDVGWTGSACTGDEARIGVTLNYLELRTD
jgi:hypothetical protein